MNPVPDRHLHDTSPAAWPVWEVWVDKGGAHPDCLIGRCLVRFVAMAPTVVVQGPGGRATLEVRVAPLLTPAPTSLPGLDGQTWIGVLLDPQADPQDDAFDETTVLWVPMARVISLRVLQDPGPPSPTTRV